MRVRERVGGVADDVKDRVEGHAVALCVRRTQQPVDVRPLDELHREEQLATVLAEVEHLHDVGVVQLRGELRLVDEHGDEVRVAGKLREDALESEALAEPVRPLAGGDEDLRHTAHRETSLDDVGSDRGVPHRGQPPAAEPGAGELTFPG